MKVDTLDRLHKGRCKFCHNEVDLGPDGKMVEHEVQGTGFRCPGTGRYCDLYLLYPAQVREMLGITQRKLRQLVVTNQITYIQMFPNSQPYVYRFRRRDVEEYRQRLARAEQ
jgi:galactose-1-phosphate uridylyltransferase